MFYLSDTMLRLQSNSKSFKNKRQNVIKSSLIRIIITLELIYNSLQSH